MARLEGAYEQIDHRLADLRHEMEQGFDAIDRRFAGVEQRFVQMDQKFMWLAGLVVGTWITTILTILFHHS